jgi:hypothetical protein
MSTMAMLLMERLTEVPTTKGLTKELVLTGSGLARELLTMETQMRELLTMEMPAKLTPTMGVPTTERLTEGLTSWGSATVMPTIEKLAEVLAEKARVRRGRC